MELHGEREPVSYFRAASAAEPPEEQPLPPRTGPLRRRRREDDYDPSAADRNLEIWKIKKLIKSLEAARGIGTNKISLIIPPKDQISRVTKMLEDEFGTASNIESQVNRLSVLGPITSVQQRLRLFNKVPPNGLVVFSGTIVTEEGKGMKVNIDFEPFKPINTSLYLCDNKFHTEALTALLSDDSKFDFIVIHGSDALFGTLQGNTREVLHKFTVDLPKEHGIGGQSALRFALLKNGKAWAGEMAQWLRALTALPEVLNSIPSNHIVAHNHL